VGVMNFEELSFHILPLQKREAFVVFAPPLFGKERQGRFVLPCFISHFHISKGLLILLGYQKTCQNLHYFVVEMWL